MWCSPRLKTGACWRKSTRALWWKSLTDRTRPSEEVWEVGGARCDSMLFVCSIMQQTGADGKETSEEVTASKVVDMLAQV